MEPTVGRIKALLEEKLLSFQGLVDLLKEERKSIENIDVAALWKFSAEKEAAVSKINGVRLEILGIMDGISPGHELTPKNFSPERVLSLLSVSGRREMGRLPATLRLAKEEIRALALENRRHVHECLGAVDGMITAMAGTSDEPRGYDRSAAAGTPKGAPAYGRIPAAGGYPGAGNYPGHPGGTSRIFDARA